MLFYASFLPQSGHKMSMASVKNPRPTNDELHLLHMKQSLCQCLSSKEIYFVPPIPLNKIV